MNDYLGNLIARTLDQGEVVQPRPVSLFEPVAAIPWPAFAAPVEAVAESGEPAAAETAFPAPPLNLRPQPPQPALSSFETMPERASGPQPVSRRFADRRPAELARDGADVAPEMAARLIQTGLRPPAKTAPALLENDDPARHAPDMKQVSIRPGFSPPSSALEPPEQRDAGRPLPARPVSSVAPAGLETSPAAAERPALEPVARQIVIERIIASVTPPAGTRLENNAALPAPLAKPENQVAGETTPSPLHPFPGPAAVVARPEVRSTPRREQPAPFNLPAPPAPAPTIQVTIGRIEVRATPPATPSAKARKSQPAPLSLAEYLRQRTNGGKP
jgi:hypothetical protein